MHRFFLDLTNLARVLQVSLGVCFLSCRRCAPRAQSALPGPCLTSLTIIFFFAAKAHMQIATRTTMRTQITTTATSTGESIVTWPDSTRVQKVVPLSQRQESSSAGGGRAGERGESARAGGFRRLVEGGAHRW